MFLSSQKLSCACTAVLLRWRSLTIRCRESPQESIDDRARVKQLAELTGSSRCNGNAGSAIIRYALSGGFLWVKIGPARRYQRACAIRQDQHQLQSAPSMRPTQHFEGLTQEGMVLTDDGDAVGIPIEVVMGSVSCRPSTAFRTPS